MAEMRQQAEPSKNTPEIKLPEIDDKLAELKFFEGDLQNERVGKARQVLREVFEEKFDWFDKNGIIVIYHGSLQYKDPKNLDIDMDFVGDKIDEKKLKAIQDELTAKLKERWPKDESLNPEWPIEMDFDVDFGSITIDDIRKDLPKLKEQIRSGVKEDSLDFFPDSNASIVLSSKLLFESQRPQLEEKQKKVRELITKDQFLKKRVAQKLSEVIKKRKERRGIGKNPKVK